MENFEGAAVERLKDWDILNRENRKVGTIHFGGIYVECLLKAMICQLSVVSDGEKKGKWLVDGNEVPRPSHELLNFQYRNLLTDLYDCMPSDVESALRNISEPNGVSYIDYRYRDNLELSDMEYDKWLDDFILVYDFLTEKKREI